MKNPLRGRIDAWVLRRVKRQAESVTVSRQRVYILPTRFGYGFALMTLVMLLGATNYSNSMAFALAFLLGALGLVCMHHTHANLLNLRLRAGGADAVFAGETLTFRVVVDNPSTRARHDLRLAWPRQPALSWVEVEARSGTEGQLRIAAKRRGVQAAGAFELSSEFPLGLFRAWTCLELEMSALVYPKPLDLIASPPAASGQGGDTAHDGDGQEEFAGLRAYRPGDSLRLVHWKSLAKRQPPMVKTFTDSASPEVWLDYTTLPALDRESRLSQLARWVVTARADRRSFGLRLPGTEIAPGSGAAHADACLAALARFEAPAELP